MATLLEVHFKCLSDLMLRSKVKSALHLFRCSLNTGGFWYKRSLCSPHKTSIFTITTCSQLPWYGLFNNSTFNLFPSVIHYFIQNRASLCNLNVSRNRWNQSLVNVKYSSIGFIYCYVLTSGKLNSECQIHCIYGIFNINHLRLFLLVIVF